MADCKLNLGLPNFPPEIVIKILELLNPTDRTKQFCEECYYQIGLLDRQGWFSFFIGTHILLWFGRKCFKFTIASIDPTLSELIKLCKIWHFSKKTHLKEFNEVTRNVEVMKVKKGGRKITNSDIIQFVTKHGTKLKCFCLDEISDVSCVQQIARFCPNLKDMNISSMSAFDGDHFRSGFQQLRSLKLYCGSTVFTALDSFFKLPNLRTLEVIDAFLEIDEEKCKLISKPAPLQVLSLSSCRGLKPVIFSLLTPQLQAIDLSKTDATYSCILQLSKAACNILNLNVSHCLDISRMGFHVINVAYSRTLQEIDIVDTAINNDHLIDFFGNCSFKLIRRGQLDISSCICVTSKGVIKALASFGVHLKSFTSRNTLISDRVLLALPEICPNLEYLDIGGCQMISSNAVSYALKHLKELSELHVVYNGKCKLGAECRDQIVECYPHIVNDLDEVDPC